MARKVAAFGSSHHLAGVGDSVDGHSTLTVPDQGPVCVSAGGQHDSGSLSREPRRDQIQIPVEINEEDPAVSTQSSDYASSPPYHGSTQRVSGFSLESGSGSSVGMGTDLRSVQLGDRVVALGSSGGGFIRKRQQSQTRDVHVTLPDEKAIGVDALHCLWPDKILFAYPPTSILPDVHNRMQSEEQFRILLVLP